MADGRALLTEAQIVGLTLWGEGRGEPVEGRIAIANVIQHRRGRRWATLRAVCLAPRQFSCWSGAPDDRNATAVRRWIEPLAGLAPWPAEGARLLRECLWIADGLISGVVLDRSHGATHYYSPSAMVPPGRVPRWAQGQTPCVVIGRHHFYRLEA